jgi:alkanesulfonate monooxygenase SsuD/methylene tetrahydromethanopterin reductase-like flavin-dependent oxidoreductase (luciferase family)
MLDLTVRYASGWDGGNAFVGDGAAFRASLAALRSACQTLGRDPDGIDVSCSTNVLVVSNAAA